MSHRLDLRLSLASLVLASTLTPALNAETGTISGKAAKVDALTAVIAIDRATDKKYPGKIDAKTGEFTIANLPLGATYDCILDAGSMRLEGVNLTVPPSEYEEEQPLTKEDIETIKKTALSLNKFENEIEILAVAGNIQHASVVLDKKRTTPFYESKPAR